MAEFTDGELDVLVDHMVILEKLEEKSSGK